MSHVEIADVARLLATTDGNEAAIAALEAKVDAAFANYDVSNTNFCEYLVATN